MRILHLCLACFYIDNYAYQENLLPRYHKKLGNEVEIIASTQIYVNNTTLGFAEPAEYINEDDIKVIRIPYVRGIPRKLASKLRIYNNVEDYIQEFEPNLIFMHDIQFLSIRSVVNYRKKHPEVKLLADCHTDYLNSAKTFISRRILHGIIYRYAIRKAEPYICKFYGTLPCRCVFMEEMYKIPHEKIEYLPFGADSDLIMEVEAEKSRKKIRERYKIKDTECMLITGGKINRKKLDMTLLMDVVRKSDLPIRLFVFGSITSDVKTEFEKHVDGKKVIYTGWANERESYELMNASDVAVFPCLHSTLWEQAAGMGLPCIIHHIEGYTHLNISNNCCLLDLVTAEEIERCIHHVYDNLEEYKKNAEKSKDFFSYKKIAELICRTKRTNEI